MKKILYLILAVLVLQSCKGTKAVTDTGVKRLKAQKVIANHYNANFNFNTLQARLKVRYDDGRKSFSPNVSLRMQRDSIIWVSAKLLGITLAKAKITPNRVSYYAKINSTYFDGDFKLLSDWLGTELDYKKVQNLLVGQALYDLRKEKYTIDIKENAYQLQPKKELELFERLFFVNPLTFKIKEEHLIQPKENRKVKISYDAYQKVGNQEFPKKITVKGEQDEKQTLLDIEYKAVEFNAKVSFPFKIPSGYEEVVIE